MPFGIVILFIALILNQFHLYLLSVVSGKQRVCLSFKVTRRDIGIAIEYLKRKNDAENSHTCFVRLKETNNVNLN